MSHYHLIVGSSYSLSNESDCDVMKTLRKVTIEGNKYYEWTINGEVGDLFTNWKEIDYFKSKLIAQQDYSNLIKEACAARKERLTKEGWVPVLNQ